MKRNVLFTMVGCLLTGALSSLAWVGNFQSYPGQAHFFARPASHNSVTASYKNEAVNSLNSSRNDVSQILPQHLWKALNITQRNVLNNRWQQMRHGDQLPALCFAPNTPQEIIQAYEWTLDSRSAYRIGSRWTATATNASIDRGDPLTLTWNLVADGVTIPTHSGGTAPSNLQARFNTIYGETDCATLRRILREVFARYEQLTGIRYVEVNYDDGAQMSSGNPGVLNTRADIRIGGNTIDGNSNVLAFNYYPNVGDMVIDTSDNFFETTSNDSLRLRNVLSHEHGHGLGLSHACPINQTKLMEPFATTAFTGPQFDDILGVQRNYGDTYEAPANNDTVAASTSLGTLAPGTVSRNTVSIDGTTDLDLFQFNVDGVGRSASVTVTPAGSTYLEGSQNADSSCSAGTAFDPTNQMNLIVELLDSSGNVMTYVNDTGAGSSETVSDLGLSGTGPYYVRVSGTGSDVVQAYSFALTTSSRANAAPQVSVSLVPDPPQTIDTLTATVTATDPDGGAPTLSYVWKRNGVVLSGQTSNTLDLTQIANISPGDVIRVIVTASDGTAPNAQATDSVIVQETAGLHVTSLADTTSDDGFTTLREAINYANTLGGTRSISFDSALSGTINLSAELPAFSGTLTSLSVVGPGKTAVSISGQNARRVWQITAGQTLSVSGLTFINGREFSAHGGLFTLSNATFNATDCAFNSSQALNWGGAIYGAGSNALNLTRCSFSSNQGYYGGALYLETGTITADSCSFDANSSGIDGGALAIFGATPTFKNCTFANNQAGTSTGSVGNGGAIRDSNGALTLQNCTFASNTCDANGGAVNDFGGNARIVNCTFSGNNATTSGTSVGSALYFYQSTHIILNTILSAPAGAPETIAKNFGSISASSTNNIASDNAGNLLPSVASNKLNTAAGLDALADNGGSVKTMALQESSVARDAGYDSTQAPDSLSFDARGAGFPRKSNSLVDVGAYEYQAILVSVNDVILTEGDSGNTDMVFTVTLSLACDQTVSVDYATANGPTNPATAGTDYLSTSGTLTFAPGELSKTISVPVVDDTLSEAGETLLVNLSNVVNATISDNQGAGIITDDDALPSLTINNVSVTEGTGSNSTANFTVTLSTASGQTVTVNYATTDSTTTANNDYTTTSGTLTFAPGETSKTISVPIIGDAANENDEKFYVNLANSVSATLARTTGTGTIMNDDALPSVTINDATTTEGNSGSKALTFTLTLSAASGRSVTVNYATADGTAIAGSDYVTKSGAITFSAGQTSKTVNVTITGDTLNENDEKFYVNLSTPINATITRTKGTGTITNDDPLPGVSINDVAITEGNSGGKLLTFTLTLSAASGRSVTVNYATADGTAIAGSDYVAKSGALTFGLGQTSKTFTVTITGDTLNENDEKFYVNLSTPINATITRTKGTGTITNDDPLPGVSINDVAITEGNSGGKLLTFTLTLSAASGRSVTVNYATADGTAIAGSDYVAKSGALTFGLGQTSKTVSVTITGDTLFENNEAFYLNLSTPVNATISRSVGTGTITNDDASG